LGPWTVVPIEGTHEDIGLSGYGYLILLYGFEGAYLAWGWGGQIIAVIPEHDLVVATSSAVWQGVNESNYMYQIDLIQTIFNEIAPVFNNLSTNKNLIPEVFELHQNYPNPFNPITTLRYDLPEDALVTLSIYDMLGREITQLVNTTQEAGFKSVQWNATDSMGKPVSAGVYLYQIQVYPLSL
jgi:hypothetical protein